MVSKTVAHFLSQSIGSFEYCGSIAVIHSQCPTKARYATFPFLNNEGHAFVVKSLTLSLSAPWWYFEDNEKQLVLTNCLRCDNPPRKRRGRGKREHGFFLQRVIRRDTGGDKSSPCISFEIQNESMSRLLHVDPTWIQRQRWESCYRDAWHHHRLLPVESTPFPYLQLWLTPPMMKLEAWRRKCKYFNRTLARERFSTNLCPRACLVWSAK